MAVIQAQAKLGMQTGQGRKHTRRYSESTERMIILLFTRLADLFGSKAANKSLIIYFDQDKNIYSDQFKLWCRKLDDLELENFQTGMAGLEKRAEDEYRNGVEMWPPSYAEFRALAFPESGRDTQAHKYFDRIALPDKTAQEKARAAGKCELDRLMEMFKEPEPAPLTPEQILDNERFERIRSGV